MSNISQVKLAYILMTIGKLLLTAPGVDFVQPGAPTFLFQALQRIVC